MTPDLSASVMTERYNMRGVHWRDREGGGNQERELAKQHREWADICVDYPETNKLLLAMEQRWLNEAKREDIERDQQHLMGH